MESGYLINEINSFVDSSLSNRADEIGLERIFDIPLVGIADAKDKLFCELKKPDVVGEHYLLPGEWLPGTKSVLSYFLPFSEDVRRANRIGELPAIEWLYGRIEGEAFNHELLRFIVDLLKRIGYEAAAPAIDSRFQVVEKRSNWSERHTAYIAGLGTFGLSKSMITKKGCAGRFGSVVTSVELPPSPREYKGIYDNCNMCGACISRCPSGAIKKEGKDVFVCSHYLDTQIMPRFSPRYGCGKCQTAVPCEFGIPGK